MSIYTLTDPVHPVNPVENQMYQIDFFGPIGTFFNFLRFFTRERIIRSIFFNDPITQRPYSPADRD